MSSWKSPKTRIMFEIIKLFFKICLLTKAPQDIPYSTWLFRITVTINALISFLIIYISTGWWYALQQVATGVALIIAITWVILLLANKTTRFYKTATALFGTDAFINFFAIPALSTLATNHATGITNLLLIGLMIWHWLISGHIFRHTLSSNLLFGLGVALLYIISSNWVMVTLFPQTIDVG